jgi:osmotically inducible lipoprotein OsmB
MGGSVCRLHLSVRDNIVHSEKAYRHLQGRSDGVIRADIRTEEKTTYTECVASVSTIKEKFMTTTMKRITAAVLATALVVALSGCSNWSKRDRNTAIGAGAGAIGGSVLTHGSALGTLGGAAVGGVIGHQVH